MASVTTGVGVAALSVIAADNATHPRCCQTVIDRVTAASRPTQARDRLMHKPLSSHSGVPRVRRAGAQSASTQKKRLFLPEGRGLPSSVVRAKAVVHQEPDIKHARQENDLRFDPTRVI